MKRIRLFLISTFLLLSLFAFMCTETTNFPLKTEMIQVDETNVEVHVRGKGPAIVLLPGNGGAASQYETFAPLLAANGYQTVAISVRGASKTTGPLENLTLHDYAADVAGVIETLKIVPTHVLGRAGGNRVARCLATDRPELVKSVILVAAGGLVPGDPKAIAAMKGWGEATLPESERLAAFQSSMLSPATDRNLVKPYPKWPAASKAQNAAKDATPRTAYWTAGKAPICVIQGLDDLIAPPGNGRLLREQLGDRVKLIEIPEAGHALLFEKPKEIAEEVIKFIDAMK
ncbi:hypothetical protein BVY01_02540 [bacterium I07]|nr:hypothetical protein BVY01_02540 [bacterium I07]